MTSTHSTPSNLPQTRAQQRAKAAWAATPDKPSDKYVSLTQGAGAALMTMGLGQTLAFYLAKGEPHHLQLARALACWLLEDPEADGTKLLKVITEGSAAKYRRLTTEALAYVTWLKRLAKAKHSEQNSEQKIDS